MRVAFLVHHAYGIGGTVRAVANLASGLVERGCEVEIASVYRGRAVPDLAIDQRVRMVPLIDVRRRGWRYRRPTALLASRMFRDPGPSGRLAPSRLTDRVVARYLRNTDADVVVATRPLLVGYLTAYGVPGRYLRVGQEHRTLRSHTDELRGPYLRAVADLHAYVAVTEADAAQWRAALAEEAASGGGAGERVRAVVPQVRAVPNAVPRPPVAPSTGQARVVVAAGRFIPAKRYDRLIRAFARIAARRPGWELRIYGRGRQEARYRALIERLGVGDRVRLMGAVTPIEPQWARGSIAVVSSDEESFGMTIVEAMRCGLPVVATDCPYGPREIITPGRNGLLTTLDEPSGGVRALARGILRLIDHPEERARMAAAALEDAERFDPLRVADSYLELFADLRARGAGELAAVLRDDSAPERRSQRPGAG